MSPARILERLMLRVEKITDDDDGVDELNVLQEAIIRLEEKDPDWMLTEYVDFEKTVGDDGRLAYNTQR